MEIRKNLLFNNDDNSISETTSIEYFGELLKSDDYSLGEKFIAYTEQVYRYRFKYNKYYDLLGMVKVNNNYFLSEYNLSKENKNYASSEDIEKYNSIVTDFLIRVLGIDVIGLNGTKMIYTSSDELDDFVKRYTDNGYICYKMKKAIYIPHEYNAYGNFRFDTPNVSGLENNYDCYLEIEPKYYKKVLSKTR